MKYLTWSLLVIIMVPILAVYSGDKKPQAPKYMHRQYVFDSLRQESKMLNDKRAEAQKYIDEIDKQQLVLQGMFISVNAMPDSFIVRADSTKGK